jgi:hypothetical protein
MLSKAGMDDDDIRAEEFAGYSDLLICLPNTLDAAGFGKKKEKGVTVD